MSARQSSLMVTVDIGGDDLELLDELVCGLCDDLRMLDMDLVRRPPSGPAPPGTRGGAGMSVTDLILSGVFSAGTLGALTRVLTEWIRRCGARRVILEEGGDRLELDGLARSDQRQLIDAWIRRRVTTDAGRPPGDTAGRVRGSADA
jgi:hypothetical protein